MPGPKRLFKQRAARYLEQQLVLLSCQAL